MWIEVARLWVGLLMWIWLDRRVRWVVRLVW
jgi:hypothetical protein